MGFPRHSSASVCLTLGLLVGTTLLSATRAVGDCADYGDFVRVIGQTLVADKALDIAVSGDYAYVAAGWGFGAGHFYVLDISNPSLPAVVGGLETPGVATGVVISGPYAYVSHEASGVIVVDVSDPTSPAISANVPLASAAGSIAVSGAHLYVGCSGNQARVDVVNISNPLAPVHVGSIGIASFALVSDLAAAGSRIYAAANGLGLAIIDISNPSTPALLGHSTYPSATRGIAVSGSYACLSYMGPAETSHVAMFDVSNPHSPIVVDDLIVPGEGWTQDVEIAGEYAFVSDEVTGLHIIDISNPSALTQVGWIQLGRARGSIAIGGLLYLAAWGAVAVVDISNPESPTAIGHLDTPNSALDVDVAGPFAYVADDFALSIIDVADPAAPSLAGVVGTAGGAQAVEVVLGSALRGEDKSYAYIANGPAGLQIVEVTNPSMPKLLGAVDTPSGARGLAVVGDLVYVADSFAGLQIVDASDRGAPIIIGNVGTFRARGVAVRDSYAYIADAENGLQIVDVTDPTFPTLLGRADTPGFADRVVLAGDLAYVAAALSGGALHVIDVSDVSSPQIVGTLPRTCYDVEVAGSVAYAAGSSNGLHVIDVSDPTTPGLIGSATIGGAAAGVALSTDHVFIAGGSTGLTIMPVQCPSTTGLAENGSPARAMQIVARPNPAPGRTTLAVDLPTAGPVRLMVYDVTGRMVRRLLETVGQPGRDLITWDGLDDQGRQVPSGVYSVRFSSTASSMTGRVVMLNR